VTLLEGKVARQRSLLLAYQRLTGVALAFATKKEGGGDGGGGDSSQVTRQATPLALCFGMTCYLVWHMPLRRVHYRLAVSAFSSPAAIARSRCSLGQLHAATAAAAAFGGAASLHVHTAAARLAARLVASAIADSHHCIHAATPLPALPCATGAPRVRLLFVRLLFWRQLVCTAVNHLHKRAVRFALDMPDDGEVRLACTHTHTCT
jgi:hypothetical protein